MMLVDSHGRNDLGRVAEYGSVKVADSDERRKILTCSISSVNCRRNCEMASIASMPLRLASLPAQFQEPQKVRAIEIMLEPTSGVFMREPSASTIQEIWTHTAIRNIGSREWRGQDPSRGGIVADSVPSSEFEETVNKAAALMRAVEIAEAEPPA